MMNKNVQLSAGDEPYWLFVDYIFNYTLKPLRFADEKDGFNRIGWPSSGVIVRNIIPHFEGHPQRCVLVSPTRCQSSQRGIQVPKYHVVSRKIVNARVVLVYSKTSVGQKKICTGPEVLVRREKLQVFDVGIFGDRILSQANERIWVWRPWMHWQPQVAPGCLIANQPEASGLASLPPV